VNVLEVACDQVSSESFACGVLLGQVTSAETAPFFWETCSVLLAFPFCS